MVISDCVYYKVIHSDGHFCVVDDELVVEIEGDDGLGIISTGFIDRVFCGGGPGWIVITKEGDE